MFDIYSLAKPRVFMMPDAGGSDTPSETPVPDSVEYESMILNETIGTVPEEEAEEMGTPEAAGRVLVEIETPMPKSINVINAASDFGGHATQMVNYPISFPDDKLYRTEFRPKQGLHNLDFTTPAEDEGGGENQASSK